MRLKKVQPPNWSSPEQLPASETERASWQAANASFWESSPMRYDWNDSLRIEPFTKAYYEEIDRRFFSNVWDFMPWDKIPFDNLIDFKRLQGERVLEIGVGSGSHAALLAKSAKSYSGVDITTHAVDSTRRRLKLFGLKGDVVRMDAEALAFPDASFDLVWSWGVIHHSADTLKIIKEIRRVLNPGGRAIIMVYHRGWWNYYVCGLFFFGLLRGQLITKGSLHGVVQAVTDGALARYYTPATLKSMVRGILTVQNTMIRGSKAEVLPIPTGRIKAWVLRAVPSVVTRALTNTCRMGSFLVCSLSKD